MCTDPQRDLRVGVTEERLHLRHRPTVDGEKPRGHSVAEVVRMNLANARALNDPVPSADSPIDVPDATTAWRGEDSLLR